VYAACCRRQYIAPAPGQLIEHIDYIAKFISVDYDGADFSPLQPTNVSYQPVIIPELKTDWVVHGQW